MDASAITSNLVDTLLQTGEYASRSPRTREALFLQVEQRLCQASFGLSALGLFPNVRLFIVTPEGEAKPVSRTHWPEPVRAWMSIEDRLGEIFDTLPDVMQQRLLEQEEQRWHGYTVQFGPKTSPRPAQVPVQATNEPVPFRPRPRPQAPAQPGALSEASGFTF